MVVTAGDAASTALSAGTAEYGSGRSESDLVEVLAADAVSYS